MTVQMNPPLFFTGEFIHGIDSKGRITLPAHWRVRIQESYYLILDRTDSYLHALSPEQFQDLAQRIELDTELPESEKAILIEGLFSRAILTPVDAQSRLLLPERARAKLSLTDSAVIAGTYKTFKFFKKETWEARQEEKKEVYNRGAKRFGL